MKKKNLFGYTKVRILKDGTMYEELCDVILGCIHLKVRSDVIESIKNKNYVIVEETKDSKLIEVPLYD